MKDVCKALKEFASIKSYHSHLYMAKDTFMTIYSEKVRRRRGREGEGGEGEKEERGRKKWKMMDGREKERKNNMFNV